MYEDRFNMTGHVRAAARAAQRRYAEVIERLGAEVVVPELVESPAEADRAAEVFRSEDVDLVVCVQIAYVQGSVAVRAIRGVSAPLLVWNAQLEDRLPEDGNFDFLMTNIGSAGIPEMTNAFIRIGRRFAMMSGCATDASVVSRLDGHVRAAAAAGRLRRARFGVIGHEYQYMTDLQVDRLQLLDQLGPLAVSIEPDEVAERAAAQSANSVSDLAGALTGAAVQCSASAETLEGVARLVLGMVEVAGVYSLDGLASLEQALLPDPRIGVIPSLAESVLMAAGFPVTAEADLSTASAMLLLRELAGHCTFLESSFLEYASDRLYLTHDGLGNPAMADPKTVEIRPGIYYAGVNGMGAAAQFSYRPGPVTLVSLAWLGEATWRLIVAQGEAEPCVPRPVAAPQMFWRHEACDVGTYFDRYCQAGGIHHFAGAYGHLAEALERTAQHIGIGYVRV
jgi:L-arabinose isomerase